MRKKQDNPQEHSVELESSDDEGSRSSSDDKSDSESASQSSEETEWTEDDATDSDIKGDLRRVRRRTLCGTSGYRPPEQVQERYVDYDNRMGYDELVDHFALGVTVFLMVCGKRPFPTKKQLMQSNDGVSSPTIRRSSISDHQSSAVQRAAARKLRRDVEFRCKSTY